jgi:hypothetical protein
MLFATNWEGPSGIRCLAPLFAVYPERHQACPDIRSSTVHSGLIPAALTAVATRAFSPEMMAA